MEKSTSRTKSSSRMVSRSLDASMRSFDFPTLIETMKHRQGTLNGELNALILLKSRNKQIVLTALHEGTEIDSFQANDSITFQIIEGKLKFHSQYESVMLDKGQLMTLHEKIKYSLTTKEETVLLLTIANNVLQQSEN